MASKIPDATLIAKDKNLRNFIRILPNAQHQRPTKARSA